VVRTADCRQMGVRTADCRQMGVRTADCRQMGVRTADSRQVGVRTADCRQMGVRTADCRQVGVHTADGRCTAGCGVLPKGTVAVDRNRPRLRTRRAADAAWAGVPMMVNDQEIHIGFDFERGSHST
jgi:hypothetical protein